MKKESSGGIILGFFITLFVISTFLTGFLLWPFLSVILIAILVTGIFKPLYNIFTKKLKPSLASALTCLIIFFTILGPFLFFIGVLSNEAYNLYLMAKTAVFKEKMQAILEQTDLLTRANMLLSNFSMQISAEQLKDTITELGKVVGMFLYKQASGVASNLLKFLINFFFMILIVYFLLIDIRRLINFIKELFPLRKEETDELMIKFKNMASAILVGNGLGGIIQGVLGGILFAVFGLESPVLWGVIMGLLAFMPILGIGLVFIPAAGYFFLIGKITSAILFLIFYIVISGGMEYVFKPKIVGDRVQLHPLMVFLSVIGGLKLFGILGIIYGPLFITAFLTLTSIYHSNYKRFITT